MALINKLNAIGDAIREKTGKSDLLTLEQMPVEIAAIETGGGGAELPEEAFKMTGNCNYRFNGGGWDWFLELYGNQITTEGITEMGNMFRDSKVEEIPFDLNCDNTGAYKEMSYLFYCATNLKKIGKIVNAYPNNMDNMFCSCFMLRELPEFVNLDLSRAHSYQYAKLGSMFRSCYSLRSIPEDLLKQLYGIQTNSNYILFGGYGFYQCYALDEIRGLNPQTGTLTSNVFSNTFVDCYRLKEVIFATQEDGTPYSVNWKNQTIDLSGYLGYGLGGTDNGLFKCPNLMNYNSGIAQEKIAFDDASYQALKNDPDWYAIHLAYSRYNHDSAVNTINSLPTTTNTGCVIKFKGGAGASTDGGAINTLTEEEIAVAAAKGWTVTLV